MILGSMTVLLIKGQKFIICFVNPNPMPNKLSHFWQELKRRKMIHVMTVYVAAAFGLLELIDIISGPLDLPDWTIKAAMILAVICLPVAFVLSWFFPKFSVGSIDQELVHSDAKAELEASFMVTYTYLKPRCYNKTTL